VLPNTNASNGQAPANPGTSSTGAPVDSSVATTVSQAVVDITATTSNGAVAGTGMVITSNGEVLTNNHVIAGTTNIKVQINGSGPRYSATVLGDDATDDIALLKIQGVSGLKTVSIGQSSNVSVGDAVLAIGNAGNRPGAPTATSGSVIAVGRTITAGDETGSSETLSGLFQIDAVLEPGDSGGPLVDSTGHVIGMDTAAQSGPAPQSASTIGFAIPIDKALSVAKQIESGDFTSTVQSGQGAILGVEVSTGGAPSRPGAAVVGVRSGSPAQAAGLAAGDVITSVGGRTIDSQAALQVVIRSYRPGQTASVVWITASGQQRSANITFASGPPA
jgi:S1-C subfamily serine protease